MNDLDECKPTFEDYINFTGIESTKSNAIQAQKCIDAGWVYIEAAERCIASKRVNCIAIKQAALLMARFSCQFFDDANCSSGTDVTAESIKEGGFSVTKRADAGGMFSFPDVYLADSLLQGCLRPRSKWAVSVGNVNKKGCLC